MIQNLHSKIHLFSSRICFIPSYLGTKAGFSTTDVTCRVYPSASLACDYTCSETVSRKYQTCLGTRGSCYEHSYRPQTHQVPSLWPTTNNLQHRLQRRWERKMSIKAPSDVLGAVSPAPQRLKDLVKLEAWQNLETDQILSLWHGFYDKKQSEAACSVTSQQWTDMKRRMQQCPIALLPLDKRNEASTGRSSQDQSFLTMIVQAQMPQHILITPLHVFQEQPNSAPHALVTCYDELASKDVCLIRVDILQGHYINKDEAVKLMSGVVSCYTNLKMYEHITAINKTSSSFVFEDFLRDYEKLNFS